MGDQQGTPLADNDRFVLGEINAVVKSLPSRMDRFETQTSGALSEIRAEFRQNMSGVHQRILALEQNSAHKSGATSATFTIVTVVASFIASLFSGFISFLLSKH